MRVLSVAAEAFPLVKTGGLGDVVGALPGALAPHGIDVTTLIPGYPAVLDKQRNPKIVHRYSNLFGAEAQIWTGDLGGHPLLILDAPSLFLRDGGPYGDRTGKDWPDNWRRFAALGRAAADLGSAAIEGQFFDILHAHDWQAGMAPAYLRFAPGGEQKAASIATIHNIAFQGRFDRAIFDLLDLPANAYGIDGVEYYGGVGYLKAGLISADAITTVSPGYAREIQQPAFGMGLEGLIRTRAAVLTGIVNGIDPSVWSPAHDGTLVARYDAASLSRRRINKAALEKSCHLDSGDGPLFTVVSRLTWQKGMDVLADQLDTLVALGARLILLGTGDTALETRFKAAAARHPGKLAVAIGYDEQLSHLLQGGADAILIPSRFEPCGLTQLYGLAYGCVPVAARTGGLADTIIDANEAAISARVATGILFDGVTGDGLASGLRRAIDLYARPEIWAAMQRQGMMADFSWRQSGARYASLYARLAAQPVRA